MINEYIYRIQTVNLMVEPIFIEVNFEDTLHTERAFILSVLDTQYLSPIVEFHL